MPLPKFKKKDEIPKGFEDLYEEKDGEWVPKEAPKPDTSDVDKVKEALQKERDRADAAEKKVKEAERAERERKTKQKAGEEGISDEKLEEIKTAVRKDLEAEYGPYKTEAETGRGTIRELRLDQNIKSLMAKKEVGVKPTRFDDLWKLIKDDFDLTTDGKPMVKNHPGVTPEQYLADAVKKRLGEFYIGTQADGGGAAGVNGGNGTAPAISAEDLLKNPGAALAAARSAGVKE